MVLVDQNQVNAHLLINLVLHIYPICAKMECAHHLAWIVLGMTMDVLKEHLSNVPMMDLAQLQ